MAAARDPEATKARIFAAAISEFAAYGIAGARVDRIARNANANKQLIYAYFGDKQQLFRQVLEKVMVDVAEAVPVDMDDLDAWVDAHLDYHRAHPEFLRLQMWEALELGPDEIAAGEARARRYRDKAAAIDDAQRRGIVRGDMPSAHLLALMTSMINYKQALSQYGRFVLGDDADPELWRRWLKTAIHDIASPGHSGEGASA
jgi:AcrR family transcriptional regulator